MEVVSFVKWPAEIVREQLADSGFPRAGYSGDHDERSACLVFRKKGFGAGLAPPFDLTVEHAIKGVV